MTVDEANEEPDNSVGVLTRSGIDTTSNKPYLDKQDRVIKNNRL